MNGCMHATIVAFDELATKQATSIVTCALYCINNSNILLATILIIIIIIIIMIIIFCLMIQANLLASCMCCCCFSINSKICITVTRDFVYSLITQTTLSYEILSRYCGKQLICRYKLAIYWANKWHLPDLSVWFINFPKNNSSSVHLW